MNGPVLTYSQRQNAMSGLPFYGKGDFNFVASRSNFTPGIAIKILPLADLSNPREEVQPDEFEIEVKQLNNMFKSGSRIRGIKVNSVHTEKNPKPIVGKFDSFKVDKKTRTIRAFIIDPNSLEKYEVYPESLTKLNESIAINEGRAKTFLEFLI
jgi:hypothetical protein